MQHKYRRRTTIMKDKQPLIKFILMNTAELTYNSLCYHVKKTKKKLLISTAGFTDETKTTARLELHHREETQ